MSVQGNWLVLCVKGDVQFNRSYHEYSWVGCHEYSRDILNTVVDILSKVDNFKFKGDAMIDAEHTLSSVVHVQYCGLIMNTAKGYREYNRRCSVLAMGDDYDSTQNPN